MVRARAAGVGSTDLTMSAGRYSFAPTIPFVPSYEIAGVVGPSGKAAPIMQDFLSPLLHSHNFWSFSRF
jgi:D-arabinose 1-dehydrogenase-like Zn-dependent alcohol dehydrogenase